MDRILIWDSKGNEGLVCLNDYVCVTLENGDVFNDTIIGITKNTLSLSLMGEIDLLKVTCIDVL